MPPKVRFNGHSDRRHQVIGANTMTLAGKVALVTGSGRNIGRATAIELARRGANVVVNARSNQAEADSVVADIQSLGRKAIAAIADVGVQEQVDAMMAEAMSAFGRVDILVNNAGLRAADPITDMTMEQWRSVMAVNLDGPFYCSQAVIPGMMERGWGRIINVSGLNAFKGRADWAHVCASKMGALGLTRALAAELAEHNILVNHIVPGAFDTTPPSCASAACGLRASADSSLMTGETIRVNGGALAY